MTNTKRPAQAELLALDSLYTALCAFRESEKFMALGLTWDLRREFYRALTAAFGGRFVEAEGVMRYLADHPHASLLTAVEEFFEARV